MRLRPGGGLQWKSCASTDAVSLSSASSRSAGRQQDAIDQAENGGVGSDADRRRHQPRRSGDDRSLDQALAVSSSYATSSAVGVPSYRSKPGTAATFTTSSLDFPAAMPFCEKSSIAM